MARRGKMPHAQGREQGAFLPPECALPSAGFPRRAPARALLHVVVVYKVVVEPHRLYVDEL